MMTTSTTTVQELEALLAEQRRAVDSIRVEYERRLHGTTALIDALERSLDLARERLHTPAADEAELASSDPITVAENDDPAVIRTVPNWRRELAGPHQIEAAVRVAELSGGVVATKDLASVFIAAGLSKSNLRNVNKRVHSLLIGSVRFERTLPGTYRLVAATGVESPADDVDRQSSPRV